MITDRWSSIAAYSQIGYFRSPLNFKNYVVFSPLFQGGRLRSKIGHESWKEPETITLGEEGQWTRIQKTDDSSSTPEAADQVPFTED
jgi:hypothetical protein